MYSKQLLFLNPLEITKPCLSSKLLPRLDLRETRGTRIFKIVFQELKNLQTIENPSKESISKIKP